MVDGIQFDGDDIDYGSLSDNTIELLYQYVFSDLNSVAELAEPCRKLVEKTNTQWSQFGAKNENQLFIKEFVPSNIGQFDAIRLYSTDHSSCLKIELFADSNSPDERKVTYFISKDIWQTSFSFMGNTLIGSNVNANVSNLETILDGNVANNVRKHSKQINLIIDCQLIFYS